MTASDARVLSENYNRPDREARIVSLMRVAHESIRRAAERGAFNASGPTGPNVEEGEEAEVARRLQTEGYRVRFSLVGSNSHPTMIVEW